MQMIRILGCVVFLAGTQVAAQPLGQPDRGEPGDAMIQAWLEKQASQLQDSFAGDLSSLAGWEQNRQRYREEFFDMLGLWPLPERTPLRATVTGTLNGDGFVVEMLHYQSRPGLYVTGNLYRPAQVKPGEKLPAVFYVCGHSGRGRDGNKTAFQSHGMWFARHGYVCLVVDTLQLGEIAATHHGTYNLERWWWHSRGYTPAGVECWNGVRGIDYLVSRADVDPARIAVTGISGGGAATFWIAAADERVKVAVPVSGMADLVSYIPNRVINGHCDCMFLYNTYAWPWVRIAGLIAPRPLLFVNSDQDPIFPMDANERVINQLERLYSLYGAGDKVDAAVSVGGHAYRKDILEAAYRFINMHLQHDARPIVDAEVDLVDDTPGHLSHPIAPQKLRVFPTDGDIPTDQLNTTIDQHFVPRATVTVPAPADFDAWSRQLKDHLRRYAFRPLPERVPAGTARPVADSPTVSEVETEPGIVVRLEALAAPPNARRIVLIVANPLKPEEAREFYDAIRQAGDAVYRCQPRGTGQTRWTNRNPPNYVTRSHVLLGRTVDLGRVTDIIATVRHLRTLHKDLPIYVAGAGPAGNLAACAALWEPEVAGVIAHRPVATHAEADAPQFLNLLRVADVPEVLGLLAPRPLLLISDDRRFETTRQIYRAAGAERQLTLQP